MHSPEKESQWQVKMVELMVSDCVGVRFNLSLSSSGTLAFSCHQRGRHLDEAVACSSIFICWLKWMSHRRFGYIFKTFLFEREEGGEEGFKFHICVLRNKKDLFRLAVKLRPCFQPLMSFTPVETLWRTFSRLLNETNSKFYINHWWSIKLGNNRYFCSTEQQSDFQTDHLPALRSVPL